MINCCGLFCKECRFYGEMCPGCKQCQGKPFYTKDVCPIYACVQEKQYPTCFSCSQLVCDIWRNNRDPLLDDEAFEKDIQIRLKNLKVAQEKTVE